MSWEAWGDWVIVGGLVAMVGMLLACFTLFPSKEKETESLPTQSDKIDVPRVVPRQASDSHRQAA